MGPNFTITRLRRLRSSQTLRDMMQENTVTLNDLIYPIFIEEELEDFAPVESMPGIFRIPERKLDAAAITKLIADGKGMASMKTAAGGTLVAKAAGGKVTVTDEKGCTGVATATLTDRSVPLTIGVSKTDVVCQGASDGTISLNVSNGSSPYTFVWSSNAGGATAASLTNLPKGNYQVTVTESSANSCKAVRSIEIMEPSFGIQTNIVVSENNGTQSNEGILCPANEVTLKVNAETNAGASISSYLWSNAQASTSSSITICIRCSIIFYTLFCKSCRNC